MDVPRISYEECTYFVGWRTSRLACPVVLKICYGTKLRLRDFCSAEFAVSLLGGVKKKGRSEKGTICNPN